MSKIRRILIAIASAVSYMYYFPLIQQSATASSPNLVFLNQLPGFENGKQYRIRMRYSVVAHRTTTTTAYVRLYIVNAGAFAFINLKLHMVPTTPGDYEYSGEIDTVITATLSGTVLTLGGRFDGNASDFTLTDIYIEKVS